MQSYKTVKDTDSIQSSREIFNNAITSAVSNNSGTAFPTDNLVVGMKCYRTDLGKTYTLTDVTNKTWKEDSKAESADIATKLATAKTISLTGKATGSASFDGSANASINVTAVTADSCTGNSATASAVAWTGITGKPSTYTPATHNHDTSYPSTSGSRATGTWGINVTGTSANVTQRKSATAVTTADYPNNQAYVPDMSFMAYWNGAYSGTSSNLKYSANGTIIGSNNISSQSVKYATSAGTATTATTANAVAWDNVTGKPSTYTPATHTHNTVNGTYSGNGGCQNPSYFGKCKAGFIMSNQAVNSNSNFKNWLYMDNYSGDDVGGATAIGVSRVEPKVFVMQSDKNRSSWNNSAEIFTTYNYTSYVPTKTGTGASGTWGISISGNAATATKATSCTGNSATASAVAWSGVSSKPASIVKVSSWDGSTLKLTTCT